MLFVEYKIRCFAKRAYGYIYTGNTSWVTWRCLGKVAYVSHHMMHVTSSVASYVCTWHYTGIIIWHTWHYQRCMLHHHVMYVLSSRDVHDIIMLHNTAWCHTWYIWRHYMILHIMSRYVITRRHAWRTWRHQCPTSSLTYRHISALYL